MTQNKNIPMTRPEELLAVHLQKYFHGVTFAELSENEVLLFSGSKFRISNDGGITWGDEYCGYDENGKVLSAGCCSLVSLPDGSIGLAHAYVKDSANPSISDMVFRTSRDKGKNWSAPVLMSNCRFPAYALQDVMLRTSTGRLILPVYFSIGQGAMHQEGAPYCGGYLNGNFISTDAHFFDPGFSACYVLYSDDNGKTWATNKDGQIFIITEYGGACECTCEPSVAEVSPGVLLMMMRTRLGRLYQSWSHNNGETWTRPEPTQLSGTHSPCQIRKIPETGHLLVVWNQQSIDEIKKGFVRTRLSSAISRNGGGIWEHFQNIESIHEEVYTEPGKIEIAIPEGRYMGKDKNIVNDSRYIVPLPAGYGRWSYPSVIVLKDKVLVSYTYSCHDENGERPTKGDNKLKVLPLSWFYGGKNRKIENEFLKKIAFAVPEP
jgi:hypothetical protein